MTPERPELWAYAYRLVPPQSAAALNRLKSLLEAEQKAVKDASGKFEARFVVDERVAHILVISDSPDLDRDVNRQIEEELTRLNARYSLTVPLAVLDEAAAACAPMTTPSVGTAPVVSAPAVRPELPQKD